MRLLKTLYKALYSAFYREPYIVFNIRQNAIFEAFTKEFAYNGRTKAILLVLSLLQDGEYLELTAKTYRVASRKRKFEFFRNISLDLIR